MLFYSFFCLSCQKIELRFFKKEKDLIDFDWINVQLRFGEVDGDVFEYGGDACGGIC